ncbi:MAG: hypothetical protein ACI959_001437 [Limisphaerales bacterium]|jgi:hypothetical protein
MHWKPDFNYVLICLLFLLNSNYLFAGGEAGHSGGRAAGIGGATVSLIDGWSVFHNPGALCMLDQFTISTSTSRLHLVEGLNYQGLGISWPTNSGSFGLSLNYLGFSRYNEQRITFAYSRSLAPKLGIGLQFNYLTTGINGYGRSNSFTGTFGIWYSPLKALSIGLSLFNPFRVSVSPELNEEIPMVFTLGASYAFSENLLLAFDIEKNIDQPLQVRNGLEYKLIDLLYVRAGISTAPIAASCGIGFHLKNIDIDLAASVHRFIGVTPTLGIAWLPNRNKKLPSNK